MCKFCKKPVMEIDADDFKPEDYDIENIAHYGCAQPDTYKEE